MSWQVVPESESGTDAEGRPDRRGALATPKALRSARTMNTFPATAKGPDSLNSATAGLSPGIPRCFRFNYRRLRTVHFVSASYSNTSD